MAGSFRADLVLAGSGMSQGKATVIIQSMEMKKYLCTIAFGVNSGKTSLGIANNRTLGVPDHRLLYASGAWLGKPKAGAFFVLLRLHALGYCAEAPRLMLAIPRGAVPGLMLWFRHPESPESPEEAGMKSALARQGYEVATAPGAEAAIRMISAYLTEPTSG